jgi:hypothetical protein
MDETLNPFSFYGMGVADPWSGVRTTPGLLPALLNLLRPSMAGAFFVFLLMPQFTGGIGEGTAQPDPHGW